MYNFNEINKLKEVVENRDEQRVLSSEEAYQQALNYIKEFNRDGKFDKVYLRGAVEKLLESIETKRNNAEPYAYLAYAMYVLREDKLAIQYLKIANYLNPELAIINKLQELFSRIILTETPKLTKLANSENSNKNEEIKTITKSPKIASIRRLKKD